MTLRPAGTARRSRVRGDDVLILDLERVDDLYIVQLHHLAALTSRRARSAPVSRRYIGTGGRYLDVQIHSALRRSRSGRGLVLWTSSGIYTVALAGVLDVVRARADSTEISRIVTDADQLSDATSKQMALEEF